MTLHTITIGNLRDQLAETLSEVRFGKKPITVTRRGKPIVRIIPIDDPAPDLTPDRVISDPNARLTSKAPPSVNPAEPQP